MKYCDNLVPSGGEVCPCNLTTYETSCTGLNATIEEPCNLETCQGGYTRTWKSYLKYHNFFVMSSYWPFFIVFFWFFNFNRLLLRHQAYYKRICIWDHLVFWKLVQQQSTVSKQSRLLPNMLHKYCTGLAAWIKMHRFCWWRMAWRIYNNWWKKLLWRFFRRLRENCSYWSKSE